MKDLVICFGRDVGKVFLCLVLAVFLAICSNVSASPYASEAVVFSQGPGADAGYDNPDVVLGAPPTADSYGWPVSVASGPWESSDVVSLGNGGSLVIKFDHKILNNPADVEYGIDLLVFGNSFFGTDWAGDGSINGTFFEPAMIEVSQDGVNFYEIPGVFADELYPYTAGAGNFVHATPSGISYMGRQPGDVEADFLGGCGGAQVDISTAIGTDGVLGWVQYVRVTDIAGDPYIADIVGFSDVGPEKRYVPGGYATIQAAIDAAFDGDEVIVADDTYRGAGNKDIDFLGKAIVVRSENGPNDCIVDCENAGRGFYFHNGEGQGSVLYGFSIINGNAASGGGILCEQSSPLISNCVLRENLADDGAGLYCYQSSAVVRNCSIIDNVSLRDGGGVCVGDGSGVAIINCTIAGNSAENNGGGIYGGGLLSDVTVSNCVIWGNVGGELTPGESCIMTASYSDVRGGWEGAGNIDDDPLFVEPNEGDYRLPVCSPCVDVGDPNFAGEPNETDIDGNQRVMGGGVDMGAYESPEAIEAKLLVLPRVINRTSHGRYVMAIVYPGEGIRRDDIDYDEKLVLCPGGIEAERQFVLGGSAVRIIGFFDSAEFVAAAEEFGSVEVDIVGRLKTGEYFLGSDEVRIINGRR